MWLWAPLQLQLEPFERLVVLVRELGLVRTNVLRIVLLERRL